MGMHGLGTGTSDVDSRLQWILRHWNDLDERARSSLYDLAVFHYEFVTADDSSHEQRQTLKIV